MGPDRPRPDHRKSQVTRQNVQHIYMYDISLRESLKFLQDRRSGERRYFTWPYIILPDRQILSHHSQLDTSTNGLHQLLQLQDNIVFSSGL